MYIILLAHKINKKKREFKIYWKWVPKDLTISTYSREGPQ